MMVTDPDCLDTDYDSIKLEDEKFWANFRTQIV